MNPGRSVYAPEIREAIKGGLPPCHHVSFPLFTTTRDYCVHAAALPKRRKRRAATRTTSPQRLIGRNPHRMLQLRRRHAERAPQSL
jgi:hypothetical protein